MGNGTELTDFDKHMLNTSLNWDANMTGNVEAITYTTTPYVDYDYFLTHWYPHTTYGCNHWTISEDKTKQAFKIVKLLMKKKLVKVDKVKDFIELIDGILEIL